MNLKIFKKCQMVFLLFIFSSLSSSSFANNNNNMDDDFHYLMRFPHMKDSGRTPIPENINEFQYVFLGGFGNELVQNHYFKENIKELHAIGAEDVSVIFPSTLKSVEANKAIIKTKLLELYIKNHQKQIIPIAHSKAGTEVLATILESPELVGKEIKAVVLVQSPLDGNLISENHSLFHYTVTKILAPHQGASSLRTHAIKNQIHDPILKLSDEDFMRLSNAVKYVTSHKERPDLPAALMLTSRLLPKNFKNDGLIGFNDMYPFTPHRPFGTIIAELTNTDHWQLFLNGPRNVLGAINPHSPKAFTNSLIHHLFLSFDPNNNYYQNLSKKIFKKRLHNQLPRDIKLLNKDGNCKDLTSGLL